MDVHLLVYDLSQGLARRLSRGLLGFQLDAVYHTSIELNGREYVYDGGIVSILPGSSHLGRPMERMLLGKTELPMDVITEYIDSLEPIFTPEAYHLLKHNCNNFSDSLAKFLLGTGIPQHIVDMPDAVMNSPTGNMLLPQLLGAVDANRRQGSSVLGIRQTSQPPPPPREQRQQNGRAQGGVVDIARQDDLDRALDRAAESCAVLFFTSPTCPPCKALYPLYDSLAAEVGRQSCLVKIDISRAPTIARKYGVTATPTFVALLRGTEHERWAGADGIRLAGSVRMLVASAWPPHPHKKLDLPSFADPQAGMAEFPDVPPLDKVLKKLGPSASHAAVRDLKTFIETRSGRGAAEATLPDLARFSGLMRESIPSLPPDVLFALASMWRYALADARVSGHFAEEQHHGCETLAALLRRAEGGEYAVRLVVLQIACNFFSTPLFPHQSLASSPLRSRVVQLIASCLLDSAHNPVRVSAACLAFNLALSDRKVREHRASPDGFESAAGAGASGPVRLPPLLQPDDQAELAASLVEAIRQEALEPDALRWMLRALGQLAYLRGPSDGVAGETGAGDDSELVELFRAIEAPEAVAAKLGAFEGAVKGVADEVGRLLGALV